MKKLYQALSEDEDEGIQMQIVYNKKLPKRILEIMACDDTSEYIKRIALEVYKKNEENRMSWLKKQGIDLLNTIEILENHNHEDALGLVKKIEKASRGEFGDEPIQFFSDPMLIQRLINIGVMYGENMEVLAEVIATLSQITKRCDVKSSNIYEFLLAYIDNKNKKVKKMVAYTIPFFPQFDEYSCKWEYILQIPYIAPKKESIHVFRWVIECNLQKIPEDIKEKTIDIFRDFIEKQIIHSVDYYLFLHIIEEIAFTIPFYQQFDDYSEKWKYVLEIPYIEPKKESIYVFRRAIERNLKVLPKDVREKTIVIFQDYMERKIIHPVDYNLFIDVIEQFKLLELEIEELSLKTPTVNVNF